MEIKGYNTEKLEIGGEYYIFYFTNDKEGKLKHYTGILKIKIDNILHDREIVFSVLEGNNLSAPTILVVHSLLKGYKHIGDGVGFELDFYTTHFDCSVAHDRKLKRFASKIEDSEYRKKIQKKVISRYDRVTDEENKAIDWYHSLNKTQKKHFETLKFKV